MRFSFSTREIARLTEWRTQENLFDELSKAENTRIIVLFKDQFLVHGKELVRLSHDEVASAQLRVFLGQDSNTGELLVLHEISEGAAREIAEKGEFKTLKNMALDLSTADQHLAIEALALARWHSGHQYCPGCGSLTMVTQGGWSRTCLQDGKERFPKIEPSVIVLIVNDHDQVLLANDARWPENKYSLVAGFVDAGETLELAVHREVKEEVGLDLEDLEYLGNQPWPFPASLMFGFKAKAVGDIKVDGQEILDARFFDREELLELHQHQKIELPGGLSIAHHLLFSWLQGEL